MAVEWWYSEGEFTANEAALRRAIGQYARQADHVYIGRTNDPDRRWGEHQRKRRAVAKTPWQRMVVIHHLETLAEAALAERALIKYVEDGPYAKKLWNEAPGGEAPEPETEYVYVLLDARGEPSTEPSWYYCTGHFSHVRDGLIRAIGQYARHYDYLKVGRTNDPWRRWREHQSERRRAGDRWEKMVVIYASSSSRYIALAEQELIGHALSAGYDRAEVWNDARGSDKPRPTST
jgi:predicted GIY-YIG superfamily endonuclease